MAKKSRAMRRNLKSNHRIAQAIHCFSSKWNRGENTVKKMIELNFFVVRRNKKHSPQYTVHPRDGMTEQECFAAYQSILLLEGSTHLKLNA